MIKKIKNTLFGLSFLGLYGISNPVFSQEIDNNTVPTQEISTEDKKLLKGGAEIGRIIHPDTNGWELGLYLCNSNFQIGYVVENNKKSKDNSPGKGIDLFKTGIKFNYYLTNYKILRPYVGAELKYENESLFVGKADRYHKKSGVGLELKIGTDFKPIKDKKIGLFFDIGYDFSRGKESKGYPKNPEVERDNLYGVFGIKF